MGCTYSCFFFQAEDGIRDVAVTGVQTCALPIFIFTAATLSFSPWDVLWRGISFYFSSPNLVLEEIFPSSPTRHPWRRLLTTARLESVSNCPETLNCARRSIKWTGWGAMAGPWAPRNFTPRALLVSMRLLGGGGLSAGIEATEAQ